MIGNGTIFLYVWLMVFSCSIL